MKKILIISAIVIILIWLYRRNKAKATDETVPGSGTGSNGETQRPPTTPTKPFITGNYVLPHEPGVTKPGQTTTVATDPVTTANDPLVNTSNVISVKPGTQEISPYLSSISAKR